MVAQEETGPVMFASQYGAGPDKTPDENWTAVLAAVEAGARTVRLTPGEYRGDVTRLLRGGVALRGEGRGKTYVTDVGVYNRPHTQPVRQQFIDGEWEVT